MTFPPQTKSEEKIHPLVSPDPEHTVRHFDVHCRGDIVLYSITDILGYTPITWMILVHALSAPFARTHPSAGSFAQDLQLPDSPCPADAVLQQCQGDPCPHARSGSFARTHQSAAWLAEDLQLPDSECLAHEGLQQREGDPFTMQGAVHSQGLIVVLLRLLEVSNLPTHRA